MNGHTALAPALSAVGFVAASCGALGRAVAAFCLAAASWTGCLVARRSLLRGRYLGPLFRRNAVLRGGVIRLLRVRPLPALSDARDDFYELDVMVRPMRARQRGNWCPGDLVLVGADARPDRPEEDDLVGQVYAAAVWSHDGFYEGSGDLLLRGTQRLRLRVGIRRGVRRFRFRYFLELVRQERNPSVVRGARNDPTLRASGRAPEAVANRRASRPGPTPGRRSEAPAPRAPRPVQPPAAPVMRKTPRLPGQMTSRDRQTGSAKWFRWFDRRSGEGQTTAHGPRDPARPATLSSRLEGPLRTPPR